MFQGCNADVLFVADGRVRRVPVQAGAGAAPAAGGGGGGAGAGQAASRVRLHHRRLLAAGREHELRVAAHRPRPRRGRRLPQAAPLGGHHLQYSEGRSSDVATYNGYDDYSVELSGEQVIVEGGQMVSCKYMRQQ